MKNYKHTFLIIFLIGISLVSKGQKKPMGQVLDINAVKRVNLRPISKTKDVLSEKVDLKPYCPKVTSQKYGTCYSYSSVYGARTILENILQNETANPDKNVFSPGFIQKLIFPNSTSCKHRGSDTHLACELLEDSGCVYLKDYPGDCSDQVITNEIRSEAKKHKIKSYRLFEICASDETKIYEVKKTLNSKRPVVIGINSVTSFHKNGGDPDIWRPTNREFRRAQCDKANHAVCIIGYDDNKYSGAFEVMNSWGDDWKGDGFIWVRYNDLTKFMMFAIELTDK